MILSKLSEVSQIRINNNNNCNYLDYKYIRNDYGDININDAVEMEAIMIIVIIK